MSLIIAVHVNEGIVLAGDRRATYTDTITTQTGDKLQRMGIHITDSTDKVFICPNGSGIAVCGGISLQDRPITGFIQDMIRKGISEDTKISEIPQKIIDYFKSFSEPLRTNFIIAGYEEDKEGNKVQMIYQLRLIGGSIEDVDVSSQGAVWQGETYTLSRLVQPVGLKQEDGTYIDLPQEGILWQYFTLQDAVDFARYAIETTINTLRFKKVVETVGGGVDILVIRPDDTRWLQKEVLR